MICYLKKYERLLIYQRVWALFSKIYGRNHGPRTVQLRFSRF